MKKILSIIGGAAALIGIITFGYSMIFVNGKITAKYNNTVGIEVKDSERNMYERSTTYIEARVQELAKEKLELSKTTDPAARKAIIETLVSDCASLDPMDIKDTNIRQFLMQIKSGSFQ